MKRRNRGHAKPPSLHAVAVTKRSFQLRKNSHLSRGFEILWPGILRDSGFSDPEVDAYIEVHRAELDVQASPKTDGRWKDDVA